MTIVTGRMFAAARPFARELAVDGPIVCYQGAAIFDMASGATLRETTVKPDVTRDALQWAHDNGVHAQCYADDTLYVEQINRFSKRYSALARVEPVVVPSLRAAFAERPTIKIVFVDDPDRPSSISSRCARCSAARIPHAQPRRLRRSRRSRGEQGRSARVRRAAPRRLAG